MCWKSPGGLGKCRFLGLTRSVSDSTGLRWVLKFPFIASSQRLLMQLVQGPQLESCCPIEGLWPSIRPCMPLWYKWDSRIFLEQKNLNIRWVYISNLSKMHFIMFKCKNGLTAVTWAGKGGNQGPSLCSPLGSHVYLQSNWDQSYNLNLNISTINATWVDQEASSELCLRIPGLSDPSNIVTIEFKWYLVPCRSLFS